MLVSSNWAGNQGGELWRGTEAWFVLHGTQRKSNCFVETVWQRPELWQQYQLDLGTEPGSATYHGT